ncbi:MAG: zinc-binding alcohol dehydrogenase family protein [Synergistetes bacterium]|nr:zinc-binding alcohol dehydrogenase family protein [Synergistota bacterium]MDW8191711.1 zinc-binding alcohol dehydrogenase family protein [Synergistota bacterium]
MKAIVLRKPGELSLEEVSLPDRDGKVFVKVASVGICGSDVSAYKGTSRLGVFPRILGHEAAGVVESLPEGFKDLKVGDRVVIEPYRYCGKCYPCLIGRTNCCENMSVIGVHQDGAFAEYIAHDPHLVHKVPSDISWQKLTLVEPLTISMQAVKRVGVKMGEHVVVIGAGTIGILAALYVKHLGGVPIVVDPVDSRLEIAKRGGIGYTINPQKEDPFKLVRDITGGRMAEVVIEASGSEKAVRDTIDYVSYAGRISLVGYPFNDVSLPTYLITKKELDVKGSRNSVGLFKEAIELVSKGLIDVEIVISAIVSFDDIPRYIKELVSNPGGYLKVIALLDESAKGT